jgi:hypothetical protein
MDKKVSSEILLNIYQNTCRPILEDTAICSRRRDNLKSNT